MLEAIKKRRSIRQYQNKEVEKEKIEEILKAAMTAPSAHHRRTWKFWLVQDKKKKEKLSQIHRWSSFAASAPVVLVVGSDEDKRWVENCAVAATLVYLEATNQGLGTCWVQVRGMKTFGRKNAEEEVKKIITAPKEVKILCLMPIGYPRVIPREHKEEIEGEKVVGLRE